MVGESLLIGKSSRASGAASAASANAVTTVVHPVQSLQKPAPSRRCCCCCLRNSSCCCLRSSCPCSAMRPFSWSCRRCICMTAAALAAATRSLAAAALSLAAAAFSLAAAAFSLAAWQSVAFGGRGRSPHTLAVVLGRSTALGVLAWRRASPGLAPGEDEAADTLAAGASPARETGARRVPPPRDVLSRAVWRRGVNGREQNASMRPREPPASGEGQRVAPSGGAGAAAVRSMAWLCRS